MRIACVHTVDDYETVEKPLATSRDIPFGLSMIATLLQPNGERTRAIINLPYFPKWRVRLEYVFFYYRVYKGNWPMSKIFARTVRAFISPYPILETIYRYARSHSKLIGSLKTRYAQTKRYGVILHE